MDIVRFEDMQHCRSDWGMCVYEYLSCVLTAAEWLMCWFVFVDVRLLSVGSNSMYSLWLLLHSLVFPWIIIGLLDGTGHMSSPQSVGNLTHMTRCDIKHDNNSPASAIQTSVVCLMRIYLSFHFPVFWCVNREISLADESTSSFLSQITES